MKILKISIALLSTLCVLQPIASHAMFRSLSRMSAVAFTKYVPVTQRTFATTPQTPLTFARVKSAATSPWRWYRSTKLSPVMDVVGLFALGNLTYYQAKHQMECYTQKQQFAHNERQRIRSEKRAQHEAEIRKDEAQKWENSLESTKQELTQERENADHYKKHAELYRQKGFQLTNDAQEKIQALKNELRDARKTLHEQELAAKDDSKN